jgi:uncharacterized UPF0160 family protein
LNQPQKKPRKRDKTALAQCGNQRDYGSRLNIEAQQYRHHQGIKTSCLARNFSAQLSDDQLEASPETGHMPDWQA